MKGVHVRIENALFEEIESISENRGITMSRLIRELLEIGLHIKKQLDSKKGSSQNDEKTDFGFIEKGASASLETLFLLRKIASQMNPHWIKEAHQERINKFGETKDND